MAATQGGLFIYWAPLKTHNGVFRCPLLTKRALCGQIPAKQKHGGFAADDVYSSLGFGFDGAV